MFTTDFGNTFYYSIIHVKLPWLFTVVPLKIDGIFGNIQGNLTGV